MTQHKIGDLFTSARTNEKSDRTTAVKPKFTEEQLRDRNRDSMFGTMLLSDHNNNMSKEQDKRMKQMQDPHSVMQQRLNDMNPMMFGDTIRLPVFNTK